MRTFSGKLFTLSASECVSVPCSDVECAAVDVFCLDGIGALFKSTNEIEFSRAEIKIQMKIVTLTKLPSIRFLDPYPILVYCP